MVYIKNNMVLNPIDDQLWIKDYGEDKYLKIEPYSVIHIGKREIKKYNNRKIAEDVFINICEKIQLGNKIIEI